MKDRKDYKANPPAPKPEWNDLKKKLRKQFPDLTDADLNPEFGKKDEMITKLEVKLGKTKEELQSILDNL